MPIEYRDWINRDDLKKERKKYFLFGDNLLKKGYGGQAKEMRGEPNAIGIPTKRKPTMNDDAFFSDDDLMEAMFYIESEFNKIDKDATIVLPTDGIGTGLAQLPERAPLIYAFILEKIRSFDHLPSILTNIYRIDIISNIPISKSVFSSFCSSKEKCRKKIIEFNETLDVICKINEDIIDLKDDDLYEQKEQYSIYEIETNNVIFKALIKKLKII